VTGKEGDERERKGGNARRKGGKKRY